MSERLKIFILTSVLVFSLVFSSVGCVGLAVAAAHILAPTEELMVFLQYTAALAAMVSVAAMTGLVYVLFVKVPKEQQVSKPSTFSADFVGQELDFKETDYEGTLGNHS